MKHTGYQKMIENYIDAYNSFNIEKMMKDMHQNLQFENISNGEMSLATSGIEEFKHQAEQALHYFSERQQKINDLVFKDEQIEISIVYTAVLAIDLPTGQKAGDKLQLTGRSIFKFKDDKIIELHDIS